MTYPTTSQLKLFTSDSNWIPVIPMWVTAEPSCVPQHLIELLSMGNQNGNLDYKLNLLQAADALKIAPVILGAAVAMNRVNEVVEQCRIRLQNDEINQTAHADRLRAALGLPDDFFPVYWNSTSDEAFQRLHGACQALSFGVTPDHVKLAMRESNLDKLLDYLQNPEQIFTQQENNHLKSIGILLHVIVDLAVYEIPLECLHDSQYGQISEMWRECVKQGVTKPLLLSALKSGIFQNIYSLVKQDRLSPHLINKLLCSGELTQYEMLRSQLQIGPSETPINATEVSLFNLSHLAHVIVESKGKDNIYQMIGNEKGYSTIVRRSERKFEIFHLESELGSGSFGTVVKVCDVAHRFFGALKLVKTYSEFAYADKAMEHEINSILNVYNKAERAGLLVDGRIPGICPKPYQVFNLTNANFLGYMMPLIDGTLEDINAKNIDSVRSSLVDQNIYRFFHTICLQLFEGLAKLQELGYAHCDAKERNMGFKVNNGKLEAFFIDFGEAEKTESGSNPSFNNLEDVYTTILDLIVLYKIINKRPTVHLDENSQRDWLKLKEIMKSIKKFNIEEIVVKKKYVDQFCKELLQRGFPTASQVLDKLKLLSFS